MQKEARVFIGVLVTIMLISCFLMVSLLSGCSVSFIQARADAPSKDLIDSVQDPEADVKLVTPLSCDEHTEKELYATEEEQQQESRIC